jgi:plastocyanin
MRPRRSAFLLAVLAAIAALVAAASAGAATPKLVGVTGPGFTITIKSAGKAVKSLKAGTYVITVKDTSSIHNFHLTGPGVNKSTTVPFTGTKTWTVNLKPGTYTYKCDIHASSGMIGKFKVTS